MSCVTVAQVTMQTRDWAQDCTILLHTKTHATVLEDSVHILTYQSTLNHPTDKHLFYLSTIAHHSSHYLLVLQHGVIFLAILCDDVICKWSSLLCEHAQGQCLMQTHPFWPMQQHVVRAGSRHGVIVLCT